MINMNIIYIYIYIQAMRIYDVNPLVGLLNRLLVRLQQYAHSMLQIST